MIGKFFYTPGSKKFNITPRFHDPDKEERDAREQRIKDELGIVDEKVDDGKPFRPNVRGQFRRSEGWQAKSSEKARRTSNTRLIVLILILTLVFYLFFYSDFTF
ncbi:MULTISPECIES: hypothetical protein [Maribellus]|uniref:Riboflavin synthase subunit beta n=1 Tax=Maribellus comscasis TaxID=2681766 RepID=A0A6I6JLK7_9BACT|nr:MULTISPECIES: hypothetical protein [Maribellus]MCG6191197.1 hypothetical protein [Maribellus maritimus]QGY43706.1 hypothetical protein GM418_08565 [Maribellus comscasis]